MVAWSLEQAVQALESARIEYEVILTKPVKNAVLQNKLYVIRQQNRAGKSVLTVAAKMGREVL
ncbi:hypothetical protein [Propionispora sp. 2/2-37]|uniref:hypothetical protein n=1 Tax=Propionispora sp. 2/2-37 TaxID=1677858 RepID=UPI0012E13693